MLIYNPKSGGGKAERFHLADEARARGIEPIELHLGDDLHALVTGAIGRGADAVAVAGGDGTQATVAAIAAEHDLTYACIPAGTRNHFALDLGVDRNDVVGALDAFVDGGERRVDLADVNGRTFVNNVSLGVYAEAVQQAGYRDAKLRTITETVPSMLGPTGTRLDLRWTGPAGEEHTSADVMLVSNNSYRLGRALASGTRPRMDAGVLGIAVALTDDGKPPRHRLVNWSAPSFEIRSEQPVAAGIDGEAAQLDAPLRFQLPPRGPARSDRPRPPRRLAVGGAPRRPVGDDRRPRPRGRRPLVAGLGAPATFPPLRSALAAKGLDGAVKGREEVRRVQRPDQLVALELDPHRVLELGEHERDARVVQLLVEIGEHVGRGGVDVGDRLRGNHDPARRVSARARRRIWSRKVRAFAKNSGRVEAEDHEARQLLGVGMEAAVVVAGHPGNAAQRGLVRPPGPPEDVEDRERDRDARCPAARRAGPRRANAASESMNSVRRWCHSRTVPGTSASDRDAAMTTAASVACGRLRSTPGTSTSMTTIVAAPTTPVTWVLAPACSATAVREPLVLTGKPWKNEAATFAAPIPIISPSPLTSWPVRAANDEEVEMVSVSETSAIPSAPATSSGRSDSGPGTAGREALGQRAHERDSVVRVERGCGRDSGDDGHQHSGNRGAPLLEREDQHQTHQADRDRGDHGLAGRQPVTKPRASSIRPSPSIEKPKSFGSWPTRIVRARPFI